MKVKKIATYGLLIALAFILSYIETLIRIPIPLYGVKLGLANLVVLIALYGLGWKEAFVLSIMRIILVSFTFGNLAALAFSLGGALISWLMMTIFYKSKWFSMVGVSMIGGVSHNIGQILIAIVVVNNVNIILYLPILMITGVVSGILIGIVGAILLKSLKPVFN